MPHRCGAELACRIAGVVVLVARRRRRDDSAVTPASACARGTQPRTIVSLVLFVGTPPDEAVRATLARDGMRSLWLHEAEQALQASSAAHLDAVVFAGIGAPDARQLARLRESHRCPLVVIADRVDEAHEIAALEQGADAILSRPLAPKRLHAQLTALMRLRTWVQRAAPRRPVAPCAGWTLDPVGKRLLRDDRSVELTEQQSALLHCLFEHSGRIVSRNTLAAALPKGSAVDAHSVDVYIHRLRQRLRAHGVADLRIETVRGRGFTTSRDQNLYAALT